MSCRNSIKFGNVFVGNFLDNIQIRNSLCMKCVMEMCGHMEGTLKWRKLSFLCESIINEADLASLEKYFQNFQTLENETIDKLVTGEHSYIVIRAALKVFLNYVLRFKKNIE